jgi:hypothetical protein
VTRKAVVKSIEFPDLTVAIVGNNAIVRHLWVSESELDGKVTNTKIGVLQVWQKQDSGWKLLGACRLQVAAAGGESLAETVLGRSYHARPRSSGFAGTLCTMPASADAVGFGIYACEAHFDALA